MYPSKEKAEENSSSDAGLQKLDMKVWAFSSLLVFIRCFFYAFRRRRRTGKHFAYDSLSCCSTSAVISILRNLTHNWLLLVYCCTFRTVKRDWTLCYPACSSGVRQGRRPCLSANEEQWGKAWYRTSFDRKLIRRFAQLKPSRLPTHVNCPSKNSPGS